MELPPESSRVIEDDSHIHNYKIHKNEFSNANKKGGTLTMRNLTT